MLVLVPQPDWLQLAILCATALQGPKAGNRRVIGGVSLHGARIVSNVEQLKVEFPQIVPAKRERVICIRAPSRDTLLLANRCACMHMQQQRALPGAHNHTPSVNSVEEKYSWISALTAVVSQRGAPWARKYGSSPSSPRSMRSRAATEEAALRRGASPSSHRHKHKHKHTLSSPPLRPHSTPHMRARSTGSSPSAAAASLNGHSYSAMHTFLSGSPPRPASSSPRRTHSSHTPPRHRPSLRQAASVPSPRDDTHMAAADRVHESMLLMDDDDDDGDGGDKLEQVSESGSSTSSSDSDDSATHMAELAALSARYASSTSGSDATDEDDPAWMRHGRDTRDAARGSPARAARGRIRRTRRYELRRLRGRGREPTITWRPYCAPGSQALPSEVKASTTAVLQSHAHKYIISLVYAPGCLQGASHQSTH